MWSCVSCWHFYFLSKAFPICNAGNSRCLLFLSAWHENRIEGSLAETPSAASHLSAVLPAIPRRIPAFGGLSSSSPGSFAVGKKGRRNGTTAQTVLIGAQDLPTGGSNYGQAQLPETLRHSRGLTPGCFPRKGKPRLNPYKEMQKRLKINQLTAIIRKLVSVLLNSAHVNVASLFWQEKMFTFQSRDRLIQAWLLPPVSSVLAPELRKSQIALLGQHFLNTIFPSSRSLLSETAARLWIQQLTDVSSHINCHPVCLSPTRRVVGDRDHPLRSEVIFSEMLRDGVVE